MPLRLSSTKSAWLENFKAELDAGKKRKQALAIAYSEQRKAQREGH